MFQNYDPVLIWPCPSDNIPVTVIVISIGTFVLIVSVTSISYRSSIGNTNAPFPEEFFVDTQLPISFAYDVSVTCEAISDVQEEITDLIQDTMENLESCAARCSIVGMYDDCINYEDDTSRLNVGFDIQLRNMRVWD